MIMRKTFLPFAIPDMDGSEAKEVTQTILSGWITTGPKVRQFEEEFAAAVGARHAVAVNSCTAAMHLGLEAIGLQRGDEVITTPYTFAATAEVVRYFDAKPVFVDICHTDFNIDPALIEKAVTSRTRAIIPVHIAGLAAELDQIYDIATRHRLAVIEDAAHAFPARYKGCQIGQGPGSSSTTLARSPMGNLQNFVCFSFYATKTITTGEGGMICTDNGGIAERCRIMALHGISKEAWKRYTEAGSWYYEIIAPGYKYNLTDIAAALGVVQLTKAEKMWLRRRHIAGRYHEAFATVPQLQVPHDREDCQHAWHLYMLRLNLEQLQIDRARFMEELKERRIGARVHFIPLHLHPYYQQTYGFRPEDYPVAYREYLREVSLPIYSKMSDEDVDDVIEAVLDIVARYRA
jgi:dTDP-4-amino-4,6-dideoxygalactose transaminase